MALHINLYHEVQREKLQRQRDPLKLSFMGLGAIAVCFVLYYFYRLEVVREVNSKRAAVEAEWNSKKPTVDADKAREAELNAEIAASDKLASVIEGRFYWAPVLQEIMEIVPRNVQIIGMGAHVVDGKPGACSLSLNGISAGLEPRKVAEDLRTSFPTRLAAKHGGVTSVFGSLEDGAQIVQLDGKPLRCANFTIQIEMSGSAAQIAAAATKAPGAGRAR